MCIRDRDKDDYQVKFEVRTKALYDKLPEAATLMKEMLFTSNIDDEKRLYEIIAAVSYTHLVARAGAGVNNIPLDKCAEKGIVVFNTPGANANGVKELVFAGMLYASRDIVGGIDWCLANQNDEMCIRDRQNPPNTSKTFL